MIPALSRTLLVSACALGAACGSNSDPDRPNASGGSRGATAGAAGSSGLGGAKGGSGGAGSSGADAGVSSPGVRWIGRIDDDDPDAVKFSWSGTGFVADVSGTKLSIRLQTQGETSTVFFQPVIDGKVGQRFQVPDGKAQTVVLADDLEDGQHRVELYRESEGYYGYSVFLGFVDGTLLNAPPAPGRLIEIIGDSIAAGYGNLGNQTHPPWDNTCTFSLDTESAYESFSWQLARSLDADVSIIARSGWGMYRDNIGNTEAVMPAIYGDTLGSQATPDWSFSEQPHAVVINLGTNDCIPGDPGQPFEEAYVAFLDTVRARYPDAWIFLTIGTMTAEPLLTAMRTRLENVVNSFADAKVSRVDLDTQDTTSTGCDYHPNVAENRRIARVLEAALSKQLGW